jgi:succinate--hydroxymethylglutarate CoA-transferase
MLQSRVENFKPDTMDRLGMGYDELKKVNPRLIYASVSGRSYPFHTAQASATKDYCSGYGTTGPYSNRGGYDPIAGAEAGLLHVTGERNGPPVRPGIGIIDMASGLYIHGAILAALNARHRTGEGQRVDVSLFETQISLLTNVGLSWLNMKIEAERWGCQHPSIAPYNAFPTKDLYLVCGATNDKQFVKFCKLLGVEKLSEDERFATNAKRVEHRDILNPIFNEIFEKKTTVEWEKTFEGSGLAYAPINNMERTFAHPQAEARDMIRNIPFDIAESGQINVIGTSDCLQLI